MLKNRRLIITELRSHMPFTAMGTLSGIAIALFLFLAVWIPCCTSAIVFPLLFADGKNGGSAKRPLIPKSGHWWIRPEAYPFLMGAWISCAFAAAFFAWMTRHASMALTFSAGLAFLLSLCLLFFFRDPERRPPEDPSAILAGADGRIIEIRMMREEDFLKTDTVRISIFLSLSDVHVNRSPISGKIKFVQYRPGKKLLAFLDKSSDLNQHSDILIENRRTSCLVKQIVGFVVRRIVYWIDTEQDIAAGDRIGMMKFGSRLDIYLPRSDVDVIAKVGDIVRAGESIVARLKER